MQVVFKAVYLMQVVLKTIYLTQVVFKTIYLMQAVFKTIYIMNVVFKTVYLMQVVLQTIYLMQVVFKTVYLLYHLDYGLYTKKILSQVKNHFSQNRSNFCLKEKMHNFCRHFNTYFDIFFAFFTKMLNNQIIDCKESFKPKTNFLKITNIE